MRSVRRVAFGPRRTAAELRWSAIGAALGGLMATGVGAALLIVGTATSSDWQRFPPPLALFVLLPVPAAVLAAARLTTGLTRPERLSWRRVLGVSAAVLFLAVGSLTGLVVLGAETAAPLLGTGEFVRRLLDVGVGIPLLTVAWTVFPGVVVLPLLVPPVALFAQVMRWISRSTGPATELRAAE